MSIILCVCIPSGSNYYVRILSTIDRELLKPNASVALHKHSNALVDVLPPEADSSIMMLTAGILCLSCISGLDCTLFLKNSCISFCIVTFNVSSLFDPRSEARCDVLRHRRDGHPETGSEGGCGTPPHTF